MVILQVRNLTRSFSRLVAVSDLCFDVSKGDIVGLMGPNGAGKTTVINLISGFLKPDSGTIQWQDENIAGWKPFRIVHKGIARTFQQARVFPKMSVYDNITVSLTAKRRFLSVADSETKVLDILEFVGLDRRSSTLARELHQDELRKLEIARAISSGPELILLDEPVSGLTPEESDSVINIIKKLNQSGITLIIVEHVMRMLMKVSHRLIVMNSGMKLVEGSPEEVSQNPQVIEAYFGKEEEKLAHT